MTTHDAVVLPWPVHAAAVALAGLGALTVVAGLAWSPARTWPNLLLANVYLLSITMSGALFISLHYLSGATWSVVLRRPAEAMMSALPVAAILMLSIFFGRRTLYPWARSSEWIDAAAPLSKVAYLSTPLVFARMTLVLGIWLFLARSLRTASLHQDSDPAPEWHARLIARSAAFVVVFAVTFALAAVDWLMSLDPRWSSSLFAIYVFAGLLVSGLSVLTLIVLALRAWGPLGDVVTAGHLHDLGKLLFAFSSFWAYIWFSQYLLIWYGNLPEEVTYYARRTDDAWIQLFVLNLLMNWALPFLILLPREAKRRPPMLGTACALLLVGHWLDLYLLIMPDIWNRPEAGVLEAIIPLAYAGLFIQLLCRALNRASLVPIHDPGLIASLNHQT